jgi:hypothetical protein
MKVNCISWLCSLALLLVAASAMAQIGAALEFDGDDYVIVADPVDLRGPLTVEVWIRPDVFDWGRIFSNRSGGGYEMDVGTGGTLRFTMNGTVRAQTNISAHQGVWVHVAATWAGTQDGTVSLYVNGAIADLGSSTTPIEDPATEMWIGSQPNGGNTFTGAVDELRIFSAALNAETILVWHTRVIDAGHPAYASLEAAWSFEENAGQTIASSGPVAGRDGVLGGDAGVDAADPVWIVSGMIPVEGRSWGEVKALFR